jgi:hypothetical protein
MEAGEHRKLAVEWPKERPWRVCLLYDREYKGASALAAKARILWHTRGRAINTRIWSTSTRVYSELTQQVFSQELAE